MSTSTMNIRPVNPKYIEKKKRREQQVRMQKNIIYTILVTIVIMMIFVICIKLFNTPDRAEASLSGHYEYANVIVSDGDSIWSIAQEHATNYTGTLKDYVSTIISVNGLSSDYVKAGDSLIIPIYVKAN